MSFIAAAVIGGSVIGALGSSSAANTQASADKQAAATQLQMFNTINAQEQPFMRSGYAATARLNDLMGLSDPYVTTGGGGKYPPVNFGGYGGMIPGFTNFQGSTQQPGFGGAADPNMFPHDADYGSLSRMFTPQDFLANLDPGYEFQRQTGAQTLRNQNTPGVGALSGQTLKDLMAFNQGMASTGYQDAFNRYTTQQNNIFARLSGMAGMGQNAASNTGAAGTQLGTGIAQAQAAAGGARAGGIVGATNSLSGGLFGLAGTMNPGADLSDVMITPHPVYRPGG